MCIIWEKIRKIPFIFPGGPAITALTWALADASCSDFLNKYQ